MIPLRAATPPTAMNPTTVAMLMLSIIRHVSASPPINASGMFSSTCIASDTLRKYPLNSTPTTTSTSPNDHAIRRAAASRA